MFNDWAQVTLIKKVFIKCELNSETAWLGETNIVCSLNRRFVGTYLPDIIAGVNTPNDGHIYKRRFRTCGLYSSMLQTNESCPCHGFGWGCFYFFLKPPSKKKFFAAIITLFLHRTFSALYIMVVLVHRVCIVRVYIYIYNNYTSHITD